MSSHSSSPALSPDQPLPEGPSVLWKTIGIVAVGLVGLLTFIGLLIGSSVNITIAAALWYFGVIMSGVVLVLLVLLCVLPNAKD